LANRLTKITTRTGDDGSTGLGDGTRIGKSAPRVQAMGDIDEANSALGVLLAETLAEATRTRLNRVQSQLFDLGAEVCIPGFRCISNSQIAFLDAAIADLNDTLPPLKEFILPGGSRAAALCHLARAVVRRAERSLVALSQTEAVSAEAFAYLNRLSDLLFVEARHLNRAAGVAEQFWVRDTPPAGDRKRAA
jgi:cob(I)alamin adenosyltransferase